VKTFKAVLNKRTKKWVALAKFKNNKTKIVAGGLNSRGEAQEYLKLLVAQARSARARAHNTTLRP
jgi:hypothetical protein